MITRGNPIDPIGKPHVAWPNRPRGCSKTLMTGGMTISCGFFSSMCWHSPRLWWGHEICQARRAIFNDLFPMYRDAETGKIRGAWCESICTVRAAQTCRENLDQPKEGRRLCTALGRLHEKTSSVRMISPTRCSLISRKNNWSWLDKLYQLLKWYSKWNLII